MCKHVPLGPKRVGVHLVSLSFLPPPPFLVGAAGRAVRARHLRPAHPRDLRRPWKNGGGVGSDMP
eukprot:15482075-Alexandrium_andersonii.AAC.1